jgi:hypothetical protein
MGRSRLIPYVVYYTTNRGNITPGEYHTKYDGRPGVTGLAKHVDVLNASLRPGGVNHFPHLGDGDNPMQVVAARLVNQKNGDTVVAEWRA